MAQIDALLGIMLERQASDLHLVSGHKPYLRVHGDMAPVEELEVLTNEANRALVYEIMPEDNRVQFEQYRDTDFAYEMGTDARFRVNVFMDRHGIGSVLRCIPVKIPTVEQLGLPQVVRDFCTLTKGLVIITGATGSGKSTTLAAIVDLINRTRAEHIITIEDPIEFVHKPIKCLINQREVHKHTESFANALRAALREDPDIVLVGEMRDLETVEIALETAETGHLVFGTLHTNTAASTIDRIIDKFPANRQNQIRTMLADTLRGVVAQTLCRRRAGGRVAALEILLVTSGVASNIREGKSHQIPSAMQTGRGLGMQLFEDALFDLIRQGEITTMEAYLKSVRKDVIRRKIDDDGLPLDLSPEVIVCDGGADSAPPPPEEIVRKCQESLRRDPDSVEALSDLGWVLASAGDRRLRRGKDAVKYAEKANRIAGGRDMHVLVVLAAAYAELKDFGKAIETANKALELAETAGRQDTVLRIEEHMRHYQSGQPLP